MKIEVQIRNISETDASRVAELSTDLGYSIDSDVVEKQIKSILSESTHFAYVSIIDKRVVGYIHGFYSFRLTSPPFIEIGGLVVDQKHRNKGVGGKLVNHLEQQIGESLKVRVRCNVKRESAHKFYLNLNYSEKKEQKVFEKKSPIIQ